MPKFIHSKPQNYYEAILQLRPKKEDVLDYIINLIPKQSNMISRKIEKKFGYDLYVADRRFATTVSKKIKKRFNAKIKISKKLYGQDRQTSRLLYRLTVLINLR